MRALLLATLGVFACDSADPVDAADAQDTADSLAETSPELADTSPDPAGTLRLDELQSLGTHNSYHILTGPPGHPSHDYEHPPLPDQLDQGLRHFELDVHRAPDGGPHRVFHIAGGDAGTTCERLVDCLAQLRDWSLAHPHHHLVVVLIEPKDDIARLYASTGLDPRASGEDLWTDHIRTLDDEIAATLSPSQLFTPADFRARTTPTAATLRDALAAKGAPTVAETRGRFAFVLNDSSELRAEYKAGGEGLLFLFGEVAEPDVAFVKADDPRDDPERIRTAVTSGYLVRTRADADLESEPGRREAALESGAQLVSTDFPASSAPTDGAYAVWLEGGAPSRCNPVTAREDCDATTIEPR